MKYLGQISDDKDLVTKGYVDIALSGVLKTRTVERVLPLLKDGTPRTGWYTVGYAWPAGNGIISLRTSGDSDAIAGILAYSIASNGVAALSLLSSCGNTDVIDKVRFRHVGGSDVRHRLEVQYPAAEENTVSISVTPMSGDFETTTIVFYGPAGTSSAEVTLTA